MQRLAPLQHRHERRDAPRPRLGLASRLHAVQDRVAVLRVQRLEERRRTRRGVEGGLQIVGHRGRARGVVRGVPPAVRLRPLDLAQARRLHPAGLDQRRRELAVALGPDAPCPPRREALQVERVVEAARLAVDPAEAERRVERLHVRDGRDPRALARELDPDAGLGLVVGAQPRLPLRRGGERAGLYGETSSKRLLRVSTPNIPMIAATTRNELTSMNAPSTLIFGIKGAITSTPMPPPRWPTPSTSAKPVVRARVGKFSAERAYVIGTHRLNPKKMIAEPRNATTRVSPPAATTTPPRTVIAAEIGSQTLRLSFSAHSAATTPHRRNPRAPTAT